MTDKQNPISRLDTFMGKKTGRSRRQFAKISVGVLFLVAVAFDTHGHTRGVPSGRSFEKFQQVAIGVDTLWLRPHIFLESREDPLLQPGQMDVQPIVVPVKLLR